MDLLEQCWRRPDDLALLAVTADALQERGDPRGELIARALAGDPPRRLSRFVRQHREHLLGPDLHALLATGSTWRHGLLHGAHLRRGPTGSSLERALAREDLLGVRRLTRGRAPFGVYGAALMAPTLAGVVDVELPDRLLDRRLQLACRPRVVRTGERPTGKALDALARHADPLERLVVERPPVARPADVVELASALGLRSLCLRGRPAELLPVLPQTDLDELEVDGFAFTRSADALVLEVRGWKPVAQTERVVAELCSQVERVELVHLGEAGQGARVFEDTLTRLGRRMRGTHPLLREAPRNPAIHEG